MYYCEEDRGKKKLNPKIQILITETLQTFQNLKRTILKVLLYLTVTKTWLYNAGLYIKHAKILHFLNRWREWNVLNFASLQHSISGLTTAFHKLLEQLKALWETFSRAYVSLMNYIHRKIWEDIFKLSFLSKDFKNTLNMQVYFPTVHSQTFTMKIHNAQMQRLLVDCRS